MDLSNISWGDFQTLAMEERGRFFSKEGRVVNALIAQQFKRAELDYLGTLATCIRFIAKSDDGKSFLSSMLANRRAMLYFSQPSTRTFLSFCAACQILGLRVGTVRDSATSSEFKGETQEDSVRTFSSYFDLIIMRTKEKGLAERMAWVLANSDRPVPIINAGSGKDQHPTQALLDVYTLQRSFEQRGGIDNKTIVFVGDLARGRTVRSLAALLTNYVNVKMFFVAPDELQVGKDVLDVLDANGVSYELSNNFDKAVPEGDAVYMTRIQDEWDKEHGESASIDTTKFCFTVKHLDLLQDHAVIMHPFPRRNEIAVDVDRDPRAMYWRQMRNGMWIRTALISNIFGCDKKILEYHDNAS